MLVLLCALLAVPLAALLGAAGALLFWSRPGRPAPFLDEGGKPLPGSLSEKVRVEVGGVSQGMILRSRDARNPVLLYLHGGMPDYFLARNATPHLEDRFTVCWWEQRGSGLSFDPGASPAAVTTERLLADAVEVAQHLRRRFRQERIYLMGHSGGTFLGMLLAARAPELFAAYVGMAQMSDQRASEREAYDAMLLRYRERGDARMVRRLVSASVPAEGDLPKAYLRVRDEAMHRLGAGTARAMTSVVRDVFLASLQSPDYTLGEKLNLWRGKATTGVSSMWTEMLATRLAERVPAVRVPVYFLHGRHDLTCSWALARSYFRRLDAPLKGFYTFEHSSHSPVFEEPARALEVLRADVLGGSNGLADER